MTTQKTQQQYYMPEGMPLPEPSPDGVDTGFWEATRRHELVVQRCTDCGTLRHTPEFVCYKCYSFNYDWKKVSGKGKVFSYIIVVYAPHALLKDRVPYNVVLVELEDADGLRMIGNLIDAAPEEIHIGMPVEVTWEDHEDVTLPQWRKPTA